MNPPFSAMANVSGRMADTAYRHIASALARLADGGRLVTITGANFSPEASAWRDAFARLQERGRVVFSAAIAGAVYAKHGTRTETRLTVIDKAPADDPNAFPESPAMAPDVATLLRWIGEHVPARLSVVSTGALPMSASPAPRTVRGYLARAAGQSANASVAAPEAIDLVYETTDWTPPEGARLSDAIYEEYRLQSIRIPGAQAHPTKLVQSAAMACPTDHADGRSPLGGASLRHPLPEHAPPALHRPRRRSCGRRRHGDLDRSGAGGRDRGDRDLATAWRLQRGSSPARIRCPSGREPRADRGTGRRALYGAGGIAGRGTTGDVAASLARGRWSCFPQRRRGPHPRPS